MKKSLYLALAMIVLQQLNVSAKDYIEKDYTDIEPVGHLSTASIADHITLYKKYVADYNIARVEQLTNLNRNVLLQKGFAYGGIVLHEVYFAGMMPHIQKHLISDTLDTAIRDEYGSVSHWIELMISSAKGARGWVILGQNQNTGELDIYIMDNHSEGSCLAGITPLVAVDVYEHAYITDYRLDKARYVSDYLSGLNWAYANAHMKQK